MGTLFAVMHCWFKKSKKGENRKKIIKVVSKETPNKNTHNFNNVIEFGVVSMVMNITFITK